MQDRLGQVLTGCHQVLGRAIPSSFDQNLDGVTDDFAVSLQVNSDFQRLKGVLVGSFEVVYEILRRGDVGFVGKSQDVQDQVADAGELDLQKLADEVVSLLVVQVDQLDFLALVLVSVLKETFVLALDGFEVVVDILN